MEAELLAYHRANAQLDLCVGELTLQRAGARREARDHRADAGRAAAFAA